MKPMKPCKHPGCRKISPDGYCDEHKKIRDKKYRNNQDNKRLGASERGYNWNWHKVRKMKLNKDPLCERCKKEKKVVVATLVHHKDRNPKNNIEENLESLCVICHEEEHKEDRKGDKALQKS